MQLRADNIPGDGPIARVLRELRYIISAKPWRIERPVVVQFPINDICDSKCQMCNIWQQKLDKQISVEDARKVFSNPLYRSVRAIGLNGGEPTLRRDLADLGGMLFETLPRLKSLSLITNGLHPQRAVARIDELAVAVDSRGGHLDVMVSLDGVGDVHDLIRGVPGNFSNATHVLDHLLENHPSVTVRVGCTVIRDNVYHVHDLLEFCRERNVYVKFRLGVPNRRLYNLPAPEYKQIGKRAWINTHPFDLDEMQRWHFGQFLLSLSNGYERSVAQVQFYQSLAAQLIQGAPRRAGCDWQHRGATISSRGDLLYCAVQSDVLGSAIDGDSERLYYDNSDHLARIIEDKCSSCAHDYVGPPGGAQQLEILADRVASQSGFELRKLRNSRLLGVLADAKKATVNNVRFRRNRQRRLRIARNAGPMHKSRSGALICGWYGTETLGDKAILGSIVRSLKERFPCEPITIASLDPACSRITAQQMPEVADCHILHADIALEDVASRRVLVFGGGPLMAVDEMAMVEALFARANATDVPAIVAGCGVGPLGRPEYQASVRALLIMSTRRIFRDSASLRLAEALLGRVLADDIVCEDPASAWVASQAGIGSIDSRPTLALGLRDWPHRQYARGMRYRTAASINAKFETQIIEALEMLVHDFADLRVLPIPFCTHQAGGDDRLVYSRIVRRSSVLRSAFDSGLMSKERAPAEYVAAIRGANAMLAMRFHSLVFASTLGVPAVAIDYTLGGKTHALAEHLGCSSFRLDQVAADALKDSLSTALASPRSRPTTIAFPAALRSVLDDSVRRQMSTS